MSGTSAAAWTVTRPIFTIASHAVSGRAVIYGAQVVSPVLTGLWRQVWDWSVPKVSSVANVAEPVQFRPALTYRRLRIPHDVPGAEEVREQVRLHGGVAFARHRKTREMREQQMKDTPKLRTKRPLSRIGKPEPHIVLRIDTQPMMRVSPQHRVGYGSRRGASHCSGPELGARQRALARRARKGLRAAGHTAKPPTLLRRIR